MGFARPLLVLLLQLRELRARDRGFSSVSTPVRGRPGGVHLTPDQRLDAGRVVRLADPRRHTAHHRALQAQHTLALEWRTTAMISAGRLRLP